MNEFSDFELFSFPIMEIDDALLLAGRYSNDVTVSDVKQIFPIWVAQFCFNARHFYENQLQYHYDIANKRLSGEKASWKWLGGSLDEHEKFTANELNCYERYERQYCPYLFDGYGRTSQRLEPHVTPVATEIKPSIFNEIWFNWIIDTPIESVAYLNSLSYESYLLTRHWRRIRGAMLLLRRSRCSAKECYNIGESMRGNDMIDLHVHHLTYKNKGRERFRDLALLCKQHHEAIHAGKISVSDIIFDSF